MLVGSNKSLDVFCDMDTDGGGWIVFQRRIDASVDFKRTFSEYEAGFGSLTGNLWLGLRSLHMLTNHNTHLRVDVTTSKNATYYATYSQFYIDGAPRYIAHCRGYSGTAGDALNSVSTINNMVFTTVDRDAGQYCCATDYHGGWWYNSCYGANLNGQYGTPGSMSYIFIIWYQGFLLEEGSMKFVEMKLR
ncbi:hypothetical protein ACJMK2_026380 [Sinanodonta woodiana]|uniref:Fibrinogen C-terminal domain-containing protein n=1 Tax=Sinanodonta woodiana TaxID=1069815 RepID=A0ABD3XJF3_SINWO